MAVVAINIFIVYSCMKQKILSDELVKNYIKSIIIIVAYCSPFFRNDSCILDTYLYLVLH